MRPATVILPILLAAGCAPKPMLMGPPSTVLTEGRRFAAGASWAKPLESSDIGMPQLDAAMHLPVGESFDIAVRAWSLGGGLQGRLFAAARDRGNAIDFIVAPLLGISTLVQHKEPDSEELIGPIDVEFLVSMPIAAGFGVGMCTTYVGAEPTAHLKPDLFVLRVAGALGFSCPMTPSRHIAPELSVEMPVFGGDELRPEDGFVPGERRHPLMSQVVRLGVSFSF